MGDTMTDYVVTSSVADLRRDPAPAGWSYERDWLQETQLLFGETVVARDEKDGWLFVEAVEQPYCSQGVWSGYPGWVEKEHLAVVAGTCDYNLAVGVLWSTVTTATRAVPVSLGTRLQGIGVSDGLWEVLLPDREKGTVAVADVNELSGEGGVDRAALVWLAEEMVGNPYLWGGRSAFTSDGRGCLTGVDCSSLIDLLYRSQGVFIPRNAHDQYQRSRQIAMGELQQGDLLFKFSETKPDRIGHVILYTGEEKVLDASLSAGKVRIRTLHEALSSAETAIVCGTLLPSSGLA